MRIKKKLERFHDLRPLFEDLAQQGKAGYCHYPPPFFPNLSHGFVVVVIVNITGVKAAFFTNSENIVRLKIANSMWHLLISSELLLSSRQEPGVLVGHMSALSHDYLTTDRQSGSDY